MPDYKRNFLIIGVVTVMIISITAGYLYSALVTHHFIGMDLSKNKLLSRTLVTSLSHRFLPDFTPLTRLKTSELKKHPVLRNLTEALKKHLNTSDLKEAAILTGEGRVIMSTTAMAVGRIHSANLFKTDSRGMIKYHLQDHMQRPLTADQYTSVRFISTLWPLPREKDASPPVYLNVVMPIQQRQGFLVYSGWKLGGLTAVVLFTLLLLLYFLVRRVDRELRNTLSLSKAAKEEVEHQASHDALTALPNRMLFRDRLEHAISLARRKEKLVAVLFINIDRLKTINESLGHNIGDEILVLVAKRLRACLRACDTVARLGGDEFVVIIEEMVHVNEASEVASRILQTVNKQIKIQQHQLFVTTSIGISIHPLGDDEFETIINNADKAMYRAKKSGGNAYRFYSTEMEETAQARYLMESKLRRALERDQYELHYQPLINIENGRVFGIEALLRWRSPDFGLVSPLDFIPLLEDTRMIIPVGLWVLRTACNQAVAWRRMGLDGITMHVNLSPIQFKEADFVRDVHSVIRETGVDSHLVNLEITESLLAENMDDAIAKLDALHDTGMTLSIDDFGTGYSSLGYLKKIPIDTLKIDRSFIKEIINNKDDASIVDAIWALSRSMNFKVVAEGVETVEQLKVLQDKGIDLIQGFIYSRPLPPDQLEPLLRENKISAWFPDGLDKAS